MFASLVLIAFMMLLDSYSNLYGKFPLEWEYSFRTPVNQFMDELVSNDVFYSITQGIKKTLWYGLINPLNVFLKGLPWWYTTLVISAGAYLFNGRGFAISTLIGMVFIGPTDYWVFGMITL